MGIKAKDLVSPSRWRAFSVFLLKKALQFFGENSNYLEIHETEQYHFRILRCPDCASSGNCTNCGCDFVGRYNGTKDHCSALKWGAFMSKEDWNKYKKELNVEFTLKGDFID